MRDQGEIRIVKYLPEGAENALLNLTKDKSLLFINTLKRNYFLPEYSEAMTDTALVSEGRKITYKRAMRIIRAMLCAELVHGNEINEDNVRKILSVLELVKDEKCIIKCLRGIPSLIQLVSSRGWEWRAATANQLFYEFVGEKYFV